VVGTTPGFNAGAILFPVLASFWPSQSVFLMTLTVCGTSGNMIFLPVSFLEVNMLEFNLVMASNIQFLY